MLSTIQLEVLSQCLFYPHHTQKQFIRSNAVEKLLKLDKILAGPLKKFENTVSSIKQGRETAGVHKRLSMSRFSVHSSMVEAN